GSGCARNRPDSPTATIFSDSSISLTRTKSGFEACAAHRRRALFNTNEHLLAYGGDRRMDYTAPRIPSPCEAGRGPGSTAGELSQLRRTWSAEFIPLPADLHVPRGGGLKSALLNSTAVRPVRGAP